jgi:hypothetical protein
MTRRRYVKWSDIPAKCLWQAWVRQSGGDPDDPTLRRPKSARPLPSHGGPPLSQTLAGIETKNDDPPLDLGAADSG